MKRWPPLLTGLVLGAALLTGAGCLRIATAPIRAARAEKAEQAFDRLADRPPEQIAAWLDQRMTTELALTAEQQPKVSAVNLAHARQLHAIAASDDGVRAKTRAMARENTAHEASLKPLLTPAQFTRYLALKEELRTALKESAAAAK